MLVLKIVLLLVFSLLLIFSAYNVFEQVSIGGYKSIKKKSFAIALVALCFSLFLVVKMMSELI